VKDRGLAKQAQAPCLSSCNQPSDDTNLDDDNTGTPDVWNPLAGLKQLALDNCASDANIEVKDVLPYGAKSEMNGKMIDMMANLDDCNVRDMNWLPLKEQRKLGDKKTGMISFTSRLKIQDDLPVFREKKEPLSWP
jgi:hypothetical protein